MHWKVKLEGADGAIGPLANSGNPAAQISRDGVDWFLESGDFALMSDHLEVKERASQIMQALGPSAANIALGPNLSHSLRQFEISVSLIRFFVSAA